MYLDNKYTRKYYSLISKAQSRNFKTRKEAVSVLGYVESHHITPKSLGGDNSKTNLVYLTAREHFVAHWLLTKMMGTRENHHKMVNAFWAMKLKGKKQQEKYRYSTKITSRVFEKLKMFRKEMLSKNMSGEGNHMFGKSAIVKNNLKWYNDGEVNIYVTEGTAPDTFVRGFLNPSNYGRFKHQRCMSTSGEIFDSVHTAATHYGVEPRVIRERIRRAGLSSSKERKNKNLWKYID
jgi:hypothetical protein